MPVAVLKTLPSKREVEADQCRRHLDRFFQRAWRIVEGNRPLVWGRHLGAICEHLEAVTLGQIKDLIINVPPKHSKSTTVSVMWPAWEWIDDPEQRWMFTSYAANLSLRDSLKCRDIITSAWYQENWGPGSGWDKAYYLRDDQNSSTRYVNNRTGYRLATTCGGIGTGLGGNRIIVDDPHNTQRVESPADRQQRVTWWQQVMSTRSDDPWGSRVIIMQRCHEGDLTGFILAEERGFEHLCLPARYESDRPCVTSIGFQDLRTEDGELLAPERFPEGAVVALEKSLGAYASAAQLQQRPSPREGGILQRGWWRYYTVLPEKFDFILDSWDMAFKDLKTSSYVCGQRWGFLGADSYFISQVRGQWDIVETCRQVVLFSEKPPFASRKYVEDKANGPAVIAILKKRVGGLLEFHPKDSKVGRANAVAPLVESGNVYLPEHAPWVKEFTEEAGLFPNARNNDQVDTFTQAHLAAEPLRKRHTNVDDLEFLLVGERKSWKGVAMGNNRL